MAINPGNAVSTSGGTGLTVGGTDVKISVIPTVQNAQYVSGNDIGGLVSFTLPRTVSGIFNSILIKFVGGATTTITAYIFDSNPTGSTFTDKGTFTVATADLDKMICAPIALTPAALTGSSVTFAENANMARMFNTTATIYIGFVVGGTFTPASVADLHASIELDINWV